MNKRVSAILSLGFIVLFLYQNCQKAPSSEGESPSMVYRAPPGLPAINYFKEEPPSPLICGPNGWAFLMRNYISKNCSACHSKDSFTKGRAFADANLELAYSEARWITKSQWHQFTIKNDFCYPNCDIVTDGEIYQGLMQWADNEICP